MTPPLARTSTEAHLYMRLQSCTTCGETDFDPDSSVVTVDGRLLSRYAAPCPRCGTMREFTFLLPDEIIFPDAEDPEFGDDRPSQLLDPGDWLWLADMFAGDAPAQPDGLDADARHGAMIDLRMAAAAITEVLKFLPADAAEMDKVPMRAFWSERGRAVFEREPGRFRRGRLEVVRDTYRRISDRFVDDASTSGTARTANPPG